MWNITYALFSSLFGLSVYWKVACTSKFYCDSWTAILIIRLYIQWHIQRPPDYTCPDKFFEGTNFVPLQPVHIEPCKSCYKLNCLPFKNLHLHLHDSTGPVRKKGWSVQVFVHSKICPDMCIMGSKCPGAWWSMFMPGNRPKWNWKRVDLDHWGNSEVVMQRAVACCLLICSLQSCIHCNYSCFLCKQCILTS